MAGSNGTTDIPIACNPRVFSKEELDAHVSLGLDVISRLPKDMREIPDGFIFEYRGNEDLFLKIARFVSNEHRCCPWESFVIEMAPFAAGSEGTIRLHYIGGPEGKPVLAEAFEQLRAAAHDPDAEKRLRAALSNFSRISEGNKEAFYQKVSGDPGGFPSKMKSSGGR